MARAKAGTKPKTRPRTRLGQAIQNAGQKIRNIFGGGAKQTGKGSAKS